MTRKLQPITVLTEISWLARVRVLIACTRYDDALSLLAKLLAHAEEEARAGSIISITVLQAKALSACGDLSAALNAIQRALVLAQPEGYVRVFVDAGEPVRALLQQAVAQGIRVPYILQLLHAFPQATSTPSRAQPLPDPLSERELEVLQCIASGQSNQAIADHLHVSLNTVKTHLSHIFAKMYVSSRTQAVARAKELRLIEN